MPPTMHDATEWIHLLSDHNDHTDKVSGDVALSGVSLLQGQVGTAQLPRLGLG